MCPWGGRLLSGARGSRWFGHMVCHCLLVETRAGLVLVDTGIGALAEERLGRQLGRAFRALARPRLDPEETALAQVLALGFEVGDVRHLVVTHLDVDHAGGLADFPEAEVHVHAAELSGALERRSRQDRLRYQPRQWAHGARWRTHEVDGETWFGFDAVRALPGADDEVLLIPLGGHSHGHCGVAVRAGEGWILHAGDAYFYPDEIHAAAPRCPPILSRFQRGVAVDDALRRANQGRLRELVATHGDEVRVISAHSVDELERCRAAAVPSSPTLESAP